MAPVPSSPVWQSADVLSPSLTAAEQDWLFDEGSLTRRLTALSGDRFAVAPLRQGWQVLRDDECAALGLPTGSSGWVREVHLQGAGQDWVYARSVAGREALEGSGIDLAGLGSRSLGELLFSDSAFARGALQACRYPAEWLPAPAPAAWLWARRSCFRRDALAVLVCEVFLPAFWQALGERPS